MVTGEAEDAFFSTEPHARWPCSCRQLCTNVLVVMVIKPTESQKKKEEKEEGQTDLQQDPDQTKNKIGVFHFPVP